MMAVSESVCNNDGLKLQLIVVVAVSETHPKFAVYGNSFVLSCFIFYFYFWYFHGLCFSAYMLKLLKKKQSIQP